MPPTTSCTNNTTKLQLFVDNSKITALYGFILCFINSITPFCNCSANVIYRQQKQLWTTRIVVFVVVKKHSPYSEATRLTVHVYQFD